MLQADTAFSRLLAQTAGIGGPSSGVRDDSDERRVRTGNVGKLSSDVESIAERIAGMNDHREDNLLFVGIIDGHYLSLRRPFLAVESRPRKVGTTFNTRGVFFILDTF